MLAWCAALAFAASAARAQVMEIRADGTSVVYAGPVVSTAAGTTQLMPHAHRGGERNAAAAALREAAARHGMSPRLIEAVAWQESRWNQNALSPKGARGVMQLMPDTARVLGVDANDLEGNVDGGAAYLAQLMRRFDGDVIRSLAAYNAGPQAVARYGGVPPYRETRAFVSSILDDLAASAMSPEFQR